MGCTKIIYDLLPEKLFMGYGEEQLSRTLTFDISQMLAELPGGVPMIAYMRPRDELGYLASGVTLDGSTLTWELSAHVMQYKGIGGAQIVLVDESGEDTHILKSHVMQMLIGSSIPLTGGEPPEPWETWLEQILAAAARAESAAADAEVQADRAETAEAGAQQALIDAGSPVLYGRAQTLTDAQQQTARGNIAAASAAEVSDLKSASVIAGTLNVWFQGWYGASAGLIDTTQATAICTPVFDTSIKRIYCDSGYKFRLHAWHGQTYMGIWDGTVFAKANRNHYMTDCNLLDFYKLYKDYAFSVSFFKSDNSSISPSDGANLKIDYQSGEYISDTAPDDRFTIHYGGYSFSPKVRGVRFDSYNSTIPGITGAVSRQGMDIFDGKVYILGNNDLIGVYNLINNVKINQFAIKCDHGNSCQFLGNIETGETIPHLLCFGYNTKFVYENKINQDSADLVRTFYLPIEGYRISGGIDTNKNHLMTLHYTQNSSTDTTNNNLVLSVWDMNELESNTDGSYTPKLLSEKIVPFVGVVQDCKVINGLLYCLSGLAGNTSVGKYNTRKLTLYNDTSLLNELDFHTQADNNEPEGLALYGDTLIIATNRFAVYKFID